MPIATRVVWSKPAAAPSAIAGAPRPVGHRRKFRSVPDAHGRFRYVQLRSGPAEDAAPVSAAPAVTVKCLGDCDQRYLLDDLVFVNYCYHPEVGHAHRSCSGMRLLCRDCHCRIGTAAYYEGQLQRRAAELPGQYPWDDCLIGLRLYLEQLARAEAQGVDPANQEEVSIAWLPLRIFRKLASR